MQFIIAIISYFIGSIPFSYLIPKYISKIDIRQMGSGNTGTTNVVRTLGLKVGVLAFIGDFLKGLMPTWIGYLLLGNIGALVGGTFAVLGHCYPVWLKFKGGKGIATSAGVLIILMPQIFLILFVIQFIIIFATRFMSLASITSAVLLPVLCMLFSVPTEIIIFSSGLGAFVIYRHRSNLLRLIRGEEKKLTIGSKT
ncbi:glycerol-3-phosphate 1-O-acyltransferase PlsY [Fusibacter sp. 3D3]|uniref:glycerol-3-phosphate 1-O-acyltransferase PlsY n=1 Tax=Fusibacter sp. 3D3 TaxID=1048380 RepID=UPI0008538A3E|nr:glycerol-3-phosphate 1-O-acyltransferase PlsY [Fusibacter sp. 3D3]GAU77447.1 acyl-phosphate:glycerol-3-phosphate O-acyltransferase PlsY [Fusibacter sp. 3D3]